VLMDNNSSVVLARTALMMMGGLLGGGRTIFRRHRRHYGGDPREYLVVARGDLASDSPTLAIDAVDVRSEGSGPPRGGRRGRALLPLGRTREDLHVARPCLLTDRDDPAHSEVWAEQDQPAAVQAEVCPGIHERSHAADTDELDVGEVDVKIASVAEGLVQLTFQDRLSASVEAAIKRQAGRVSALFDPPSAVVGEDDIIGAHGDSTQPQRHGPTRNNVITDTKAWQNEDPLMPAQPT
jgi:hypothetical protein